VSFTSRRRSITISLFSLAALAAIVTAAGTNRFTPNDKPFYADQSAIAFVRPGLMIDILSAEVSTEGVIRARVKFTDPAGLPLDREGITTPGTISAGNPGMIAAVYAPDRREFSAYTTRTLTSPITQVSATQAGTDSGGTWEKVGDGEYVYTFRTRAPSGFDRSAVHAIGVYGSRDLTEFDLGIHLDDDVFYFTPSDGREAANPDDDIRTATCQKCHGPNMHFHGETGRTSFQMCQLCHTSQTTDPDTRNTVDAKVMIHKIHMGAELPSVRAGGKYQIIGFGQAVNDYSTVEFPSPIMKCEVCHEQNRNAAAADVHLRFPNRAACGACHDNVNFATGENHAGLPQFSDNQCRDCHIPQGEYDFDVSILGAHVVPQESSLLGGLAFGIVRVEDGTAGRRPSVTFTVRDKNGNPLALSDLNRIALTMAGPTADYTAFGRGYVQEDASTAQGSSGAYTYTFNTPIPDDAKGTFAVGVEGRRVERVLTGTTLERSIQYGATNPVSYFSVDGSPVEPRRQPTAQNNCLNCHYRLALHGENRINNIAYCQFCHNPVETDTARRPAAAQPGETIAFKFMIHRIHGGEELHQNFGIDYTIYGFGGTPISFKEVRFPPPLNECFMCHVNGSESPALPTLRQSPVNTPRHPIPTMAPVTASCYSCHAHNAMLSHAVANTTALGESCTVCHGPSAEFSATRVHADEVVVSRDQASK
jgi:OmcA/MtrC family decaheme c-type cytochrome